MEPLLVLLILLMVKTEVQAEEDLQLLDHICPEMEQVDKVLEEVQAIEYLIILLVVEEVLRNLENPL